MLDEENGVDAIVIESMLPDLIAEELCVLVSVHFPETCILVHDVNSEQTRTYSVAADALGAELHMLLAPAETSQITIPEVLPGSRRSWIPRSHTQLSRRLIGMVGDSLQMQSVYALTHMVAVRTATVLVTGESGTGKDLVAQAIHGISDRARQPFIIVNCAALPEALLEAELFGHAKGAFTGALQSRIGRIHAAHGGTLFLDEIGDMPVSLQSKLLRFLEQGELQRLGSNDTIKVNVRVVAATHCDLKKLAARKLFREDLYYRLAVFMIHLPPVRERQSDIMQLLLTFAKKYCSGVGIHPSVTAMLSGYCWPGNVRELRNVVERASILIGQEREMTLDHILL